jgi:hypothetical protein
LSAILKALRRIEKESAGEAQPQSFSKRLDAKKVISHRARKAWILRRAISILVPCVALAAAIGLIIALKTFLPQGRVLLTHLSRVQGEAEKGKEISMPEPGSGHARSTEEAHRAETPNKVPEDMRSSTGASSVQELPSFSRRSPEATMVPRTSGQPVVSAENRPQSEPNPVLELQAIVWSDDPASCFAVINGRIVRSGGMVAGVSVVEISKDAVSLKLGDKAWSVRMLEGD